MCEAIFEAQDAGWVSARGQVLAQNVAAVKYGCTIVEEHVKAVHKADGGSNHFTICTASGSLLMAKKVLVSSGAFTNFRPLLPDTAPGTHLKLDVDLLTAQVVKLQLQEDDQRRLASMPSVIFQGKEYWCYILPPALYPDGNFYLKLGGGRFDNVKVVNGKVPVFPGLPGKQILENEMDVLEWYRSGGCPDAEAQMLQMINDIVPGLAPVSVHSDVCVTTHTRTGQAYCGLVADNLGVLVGGNGLAAKSSDELGRLAALCMLSKEGWDTAELPAAIFAPRLLPWVPTKEKGCNIQDEASERHDYYSGPP